MTRGAVPTEALGGIGRIRKRRRQFGDGPDQMIHTCRSRRLDDEIIVLIELIEPEARHRGREEALQAVNRRNNSILAAGAEISTNSFCLRPQPGNQIVRSAIGQYSVDRDPTTVIDAVSIGKCNEPVCCRALRSSQNPPSGCA